MERAVSGHVGIAGEVEINVQTVEKSGYTMLIDGENMSTEESIESWGRNYDRLRV